MEKRINLTSAEIGTLWTAFLNDTMTKCVTGFMLKHIQDDEIKVAVQSAYDISDGHIQKLLPVFEQEKYAVPVGFSKEDVNMDAPWLFSDVFCLSYVKQMATVGMLTFSGAVAMSTRDDMRNFFTQGLHETSYLYNQTTEIALIKGINSRHPYIEVPKETDYIDSKKYLSGLNPFSEKRPLNSIEISHLYMNVMTNSIGMKLSFAFAQTSPTKEVQEYMLRSKDISQKHIKIFVDTLLKDEIETPQAPDLGISNSTTKTFSDKLMMFHMSLIASAGIGNYATAAAASQRMDLAANYERLSLEVAKLAKSGTDIMIKHNWLEQPPGVKNREKLAREKK